MNLPICPFCESTDTTYKAKAAVWECNNCEKRFNLQENKVPNFEPQTIFLSYAHRSENDHDFDISEELVKLVKFELEKDGHTVWIDYEGLKAGSQWREGITAAILNHQHFILFLSKRSVRVPGVCLNEVALAIQNNRIIQTVLTETEENIRQPLTISHIQWHTFENWRQIRDGEVAGPGGESWVEWFNERMAEIKANLSDIQKIQTSGDLQRLKDILEPKTFEADIIKNVEGFYGRQWLFEAFHDWLDHSKNRLFWITGGPGIGKSSFAAKLVHNVNSAVVGFFKCEYQGSKTPEESASECIRTLAYQLAARLPDYRQKLMYQQLIDKDKVGKKTADDLFTYLISEPLNVSGKIPEATRLVLVIDALDEAGRSDGSNALADLIHKNVDKLPHWLGLLVTSRPEPYLELQLGGFEKTTIDGQADENIRDLKNYLNEYLVQNYSNELIADKRSSIIDTIVEKSGGTFLYIKRVQDKYDLSKPEELPSGIDDLFHRDFKRYFPIQSYYDEHIEPYLRLLVAAPGPLPPEMAIEVLKIDSRFLVTKIFNPMGSLILEKSSGTAFFHKSISDWLIDPKRSLTYVVSDSGQREIGEFLWNEFENIANTKWHSFILEWLNSLVAATDIWINPSKLEGLAVFYEKHLKYSNAFDIRKQQITTLEFQNIRDLSLTQVIDNSGLLLFAMGRFQECEEYFNKSLSIKRTIESLDQTEIAMSLLYIADKCYKVAEWERGEVLYRESLQTYEKFNENDTVEKANIIDRLAGLLNAVEKNVECEELIKRSLDIRLKLLGENHPDTAISYNRYAILVSDLDRMMEAEGYYQIAMKIFEANYGKSHPNFARSLNNYAALISDMGRHSEALDYFKEAMDIRVNVLGREHPDCAESFHNLANIYCLLDQNNLAESLYRKALNIRLNAFGEDGYATNNTRYRLANLLENMGKKEEAHRLYDQVLSSKNIKIGINSPTYTYDLH